MLEGVANGAAVAAGAVAVVATALALLRVKVWWVRIWDFPRLQVAFLGTSALALGLGVSAWETALEVAFAVALGAAVLYQTLLIWRYTRLAPVEVQLAEHDDGERRVSLVMSNVLQTNRDADRLLRMVLERDPDVVLCVETDEWWRQRLDVLERDRPHVLRCPLPNTYGMLLYSRLPLEDAQIDFLVQPDIRRCRPSSYWATAPASGSTASTRARRRRERPTSRWSATRSCCWWGSACAGRSCR
jgi:endonuclease/exonuclease/phosphatase (EEP) superfamily protein YafD